MNTNNTDAIKGYTSVMDIDNSGNSGNVDTLANVYIHNRTMIGDKRIITKYKI